MKAPARLVTDEIEDGAGGLRLLLFNGIENLPVLKLIELLLLVGLNLSDPLDLSL